jgi:hypothetical protein
MTTRRDQRTMTCSECGIDMNRHATRIVEPRTREEAARMDEALGGLRRDVFCCPGCGKGAARHVD